MRLTLKVISSVFVAIIVVLRVEVVAMQVVQVLHLLYLQRQMAGATIGLANQCQSCSD